jgi:GNAT superfamily N-acetyltransferase
MEVRIGVRDPRDPDAQTCLRAYETELASRFDDGFDPALSISAADEEMTPPAGLFLVASVDGEPAGCGALKFHGDAPAEIKRMWVASSARGLGLGRRARGARGRARRPGTEAGNQPDAARGDQPVPVGWLPRGGGVQRRAVRAPLVREVTGAAGL